MATEPLSPSPTSAGPLLGTEAAPASEATAVDSAAVPESGSIASHAAELETRQDERNDKGQFVRGGRHRARSQQASPDDVPRIAELTRRLHETEAERDALKAPKPAAAAPAPTPAPARPQAAPAPAAPIVSTADDPEPDQDGYDDFGKWLRDHSRWAARQEMREASERYTQAEQQRQRQAESDRINATWHDRIEEAKKIYPDFKQVALDAPTPIPEGSFVDMWIREHKNGNHVLYYLQKNLTEAQRVLSLQGVDLVDELSLLGQRLNPQRSAAVATGAAPAPHAQPVPRPPTPVRTGPMRTGDEPPAEDHSVAEHRKFYDPRRSR